MTEVLAVPGPVVRPGFSALRREHAELQAHLRGHSTGSATPQDMERIELMMETLQRAGAWIVQEDERHDLQIMLDHWAVVRVTLGSLDPSSVSLPQLATVELRETPAVDGEENATTLHSADLERARERIRLAALARQWLQSGRKPGYLLTGQAVDDARPFRADDGDIAALLEESEIAIANTQAREVRRLQRRNRQKNTVIAALVVSRRVSVEAR